MKLPLVSPPTDSTIKQIVGTTGPSLSLAYLASKMFMDKKSFDCCNLSGEVI